MDDTVTPDSPIDVLKARARQAYAAGDLEIPQYMAVLDLLAQQDHGAVRRILDRLDQNRHAPNQAAVTEAGRRQTQARLTADLDRLLALVGARMYQANLVEVTLKEMLQNSFDAAKASLAQGLEHEGRIDIVMDSVNRLIVIRDNGQGMTPQVIREAFLTLAGTRKDGLAPGTASGGFGMAKAAFLLGNERLYVRTSRDGVRSTFATHGAAILSNTIDVIEDKVSRNEHGTTLIVKVPEHVMVEGEAKPVWFPWAKSSVRLFERPMLHGAITVNYAKQVLSQAPADLLAPDALERAGVVLESLPLAKHFDLSGYAKHTTAHFSWGKAQIYLGVQRKEGWTDTVHSILSAGLFQFTTQFMLSPGELLPYDIIVDVCPTVPADSPVYPFDIRREGWKSTLQADIEALSAYLRHVALGKEAEGIVATFQTLRALPRLDVELSTAPYGLDIADFIPRKPSKPVAAAGADAKLRVPPAITIRGGKVTGLDAVDREQILVDLDAKRAEKGGTSSFQADKAAPTAKDFLLEVGIDTGLPVFHNNTNVDYTEIGRHYGAADTLFAQIGSLMLAMKDKVAEAGGWGYARLKDADRPFFVGISIDKAYHGVNITVPFNGIFLNPLTIKGHTLPGIASGLYETLVHEFTHIQARGHDETFSMNYHRLSAALAADGFDIELRMRLGRILKNYQSLFNELREEFEKSTTHNVAKSLHGVAHAMETTVSYSTTLARML